MDLGNMMMSGKLLVGEDDGRGGDVRQVVYPLVKPYPFEARVVCHRGAPPHC